MATSTKAGLLPNDSPRCERAALVTLRHEHAATL
jgi:hypothetical protein